jgi:hypothetical protein
VKESRSIEFAYHTIDIISNPMPHRFIECRIESIRPRGGVVAHVLDDGVKLMLVQEGTDMLVILETHHLLSCIVLVKCINRDIRSWDDMVRENILEEGSEGIGNLLRSGRIRVVRVL